MERLINWLGVALVVSCLARGQVATRQPIPGPIPSGYIALFDGNVGTYQDVARTTPASANGDPVGSWSGSALYATQSTNAARPSLDKTLSNYGVRFTSSSSCLDFDTDIFPSAVTNFTCFIVCAISNTAPSGAVILTGNKSGSNAGDWQIGLTTGATNTFSFFYDNATTLTCTSALDQNSVSVITCVLTNGASAEFFGYPTSNTTSGSIGGNSQKLRMALQTTGTTPFVGTMYYVLIYSRTLTPSELFSVHTYLGRRFSVPWFYDGTFPVFAVTELSISDSDVHAAQGVASDGANFYTDAGTGIGVNNFLYKWTVSGNTYTPVATNDCSAEWPSGATQVSSLYYATNAVYVGCNNYSTEPRAGYILVYDADLVYQTTYTVSTNWCEGGAWGPNGNFFVVYNDTHTVDERLATDFSRVKSHSVAFTHTGGDIYQGLIWWGNYAMMNTHEGSTPQTCDILFFARNRFYPIQRLTPPRPEDSQGMYLDASHYAMYWANRYYPSTPTQDHRVLKSSILRNSR